MSFRSDERNDRQEPPVPGIPGTSIRLTDPETMRFLNDDIGLYVQANPDGQELVADWYMREKDPLKRSMNGLPRLWAKYIGHDDNRDFYMSNMKETTNMNRQLFLEWFPQIMYNHHQTGSRRVCKVARPATVGPDHQRDVCAKADNRSCRDAKSPH